VIEPDPDAEAARAAASLARDIAAREITPYVDAWGAPDAAGPPAAVRAPFEHAGLRDVELPPLVHVEVGIELGRAGLLAAVEVQGVDPTRAPDLRLAAALCGAGDALVACGIAYAKDRVVFGRPLARMPVQRNLFARAAAAVDAATALCRRAAAVGDPLDVAAALSVAADAAWLAAETALQVHGGNGYSDEYPVSRMWREVAAVRAALPRAAADDATWDAVTWDATVIT
jgi:hypothetical protein